MAGKLKNETNSEEMRLVTLLVGSKTSLIILSMLLKL